MRSHATAHKRQTDVQISTTSLHGGVVYGSGQTCSINSKR
jgi:hypothetical protein